MIPSTPLTPFTIGIELIDDPDWMGGTLYLRNLALCLARLPESERPGIRLLGEPGVVSAFIAQHPGVFSAGVARTQSRWQRLLVRLGIGHARANSGIDIVYPGFGSTVPGAITMRWIPDFQHRHLPQLFSQAEITARDRAIGDIAGKPGVVVLSSQVAVEDFNRFFPGHLATPRVWHFHSLLELDQRAHDAVTEVRNAHKLPDKYLYLPNQFWVHKNHVTVLRALAAIRQQKGLVIPLVCTGAQSDRRNASHFGSLQSFIAQNGMDNQVHMLGLLARREQVAVLRGAAAVVQPSLFEGWSTVVEDVRACGRTIFLSDIPVHREQSPPCASYFEPENVEQLAEMLAADWSSLRPGPDVAAECEARKSVERLIGLSGLSFCNTARDAIASRVTTGQ